MARRLPDDPVKRRLQVFKRIYQHLDHFWALIEDGRMEMPGVLTLPTGEDVYLNDLLVGLDSLPRRQREAFELICLQGYTETAARDKMLPNSKSSTPVQQYSDSGLVRMVARYDEKQAGPRRILMAAMHPLLKRHLEEARKDIIHQMEGLKLALGQVDELLGKTGSKAPSSPPPTPKPTGKPSLDEMARELVETA